MSALALIPADIIVAISAFLDATTLLSLQASSKELNEVLSLPEHDEYLWSPHLASLTKGKIISTLVQSLTADMKFKVKYRHLKEDAKRAHIYPEELMSTTFAFRFKACAGEFWASLDPYWIHHGQEFFTRSFTSDSKVISPDRVDALELWARESNLAIQWRITKSRNGEKGHFLQINRWPSMVIERDLETWGWTIHNQWCAYISPPTINNLSRLHVRLEKDVDRFL